VTGTFDAWLNAEISARRIRSAPRLALESGLDPDKVAEWMLASSMPSDDECAKLAAHLKVDVADMQERRFPHRRPPPSA